MGREGTGREREGEGGGMGRCSLLFIALNPPSLPGVNLCSSFRTVLLLCRLALAIRWHPFFSFLTRRAEKEFRNLNRLTLAGVHCPKAIILRSHVLVMEFFGVDGWAYGQIS